MSGDEIPINICKQILDTLYYKTFSSHSEMKITFTYVFLSQSSQICLAPVTPLYGHPCPSLNVIRLHLRKSCSYSTKIGQVTILFLFLFFLILFLSHLYSKHGAQTHSPNYEPPRSPANHSFIFFNLMYFCYKVNLFKWLKKQWANTQGIWAVGASLLRVTVVPRCEGLCISRQPRTSNPVPGLVQNSPIHPGAT